MIEHLYAIVDVFRHYPQLLLSGLPLALTIVLLLLLMPRRWLVITALAVVVVLAIAFFGRMP
jgi:hypothetical protein